MWNGKNKALTFSYDDGVSQDIRLVEILNRYGMKCTFNLNSGIMGAEGSFRIGDVSVDRLEPTVLKELYMGHEIAVHGLTHPSFTALDDDELYREISEDKKNLEELFGTQICGMAYPYGTFDERVEKIARDCGIRCSRTVLDAENFAPQKNLLEFRATCHHKNPELFRLLDEFLQYSGTEPAIFCLWGHSYEFEVDGNWNLIEEFCRIAGGRNDIFYGTNSEVLLDGKI